MAADDRCHELSSPGDGRLRIAADCCRLPPIAADCRREHRCGSQLGVPLFLLLILGMTSSMLLYQIEFDPLIEECVRLWQVIFRAAPLVAHRAPQEHR